MQTSLARSIEPCQCCASCLTLFYMRESMGSIDLEIFVTGGCGSGEEELVVTLDGWKQSSGACQGRAKMRVGIQSQIYIVELQYLI